MVRDTLPAYLRLTLEYYPELIDARVLTSAYVTVFKHLPEHDLMLLYAVKLLIERTRAVMEEQKAKFVLSRLQRNRISSSSPSSSSMDLKVGGGRGRGGATAVGVGEESASPSAPSASESESFSLSAAEHLFTMTWQLLQLIDISLLDEVLTMIQEELMQQNPSPSSPSSSSVSGVNKGRDDEVVKQANMRVRVALLRVAYKILSSNFDMYRRDICIQWFIDMTVKYSIRRSVFLTVEEGAV